MKTKIKFGFRGKGQLPLFMIWKEWIDDGEVVFGRVLLMVWGRKKNEYER